MKLLLDENLPHRLYKDFPAEHPAYSAKFMGWEGLKNGELLSKMIEENFDALVTWDHNIEFQQNFKNYPVTVFCFHTPDSKYETLKPLVSKIISAINHGTKSGVVSIE